jgi:hypothetical protein
MDLSVIIAGAGLVGGVALYVIRAEMRGDVTRLDGRLNAHEEGCTIRQKSLERTLASIDKKLDRHDEKLDRLMGQP